MSGKMSAQVEKQSKSSSVYKTVQLDVVELLKQVLQWTPLYKQGLNKALIQAAKVGSYGCVKVLLSAGTDCDTEDDNGDTAFVHAFRCRHADVMELLYEAGATTEIAKMSLALASKDPAFVKLCYRVNIPVENEDWNVSDIDEVRMLLTDLKLDPFEGQYGDRGFNDSPFMYLVQEGKPEVLELLVSKHPCVEKYSETALHSKFNQALHKAVRYHRLDNTKLLLAALGADMEAMDSQGRTAFLLACGHDQVIAQYLLDLGADPRHSDHEGLTALHWAACMGYAKLCHRLLTQKGLPIDAIAKQGATPLMVACSSRYTDVVEVFIEYGCNVNLATPDGWTALHVAVRACTPVIVKQLLTNGANVDAQSSTLTHNGDIVPGTTPLLIAIAMNSVRIIRHLFDANCDINLSGIVFINPSFSSSESDEDTKYRKQKCTPVQHAFLSHAWDIAAILIKAGCDVSCIRRWVQTSSAPVHVPKDKLKYLNHLVAASLVTPPKLRHLVRRQLRRILGRRLLMKVDKLTVPSSAKHFILCRDLFRPTTGSFEV
ncbi:hypothetical protein LSAT2_014129 [Lamellibrachia satsuma]|nr:hypothetical protein LSAT2_014129 [Lamellibrachia satsuma]